MTTFRAVVLAGVAAAGLMMSTPVVGHACCPGWYDDDDDGPGLFDCCFNRCWGDRYGCWDGGYYWNGYGGCGRSYYWSGSPCWGGRYYDSCTYYTPMTAAAPANTVSVRVVVPPDAKVWFFDQAMKTTGGERFFESPPVTPGEKYSYDIKAQWRGADGKEVTQTQHVLVSANARVDVDFTRTGARDPQRISLRP